MKKSSFPLLDAACKWGGVSSRSWHKMNSVVAEIGRTLDKLEIAKCHCMANKNSVVKSKVPELESTLESLRINLENQCDEWLVHIQHEKRFIGVK
jgi:hypothetical protein